ncbi:MAG TPA: ribosome maturation factor RimP [Acidimicrobiales bacterium]|nr:ribosome maturation factor RimP [Acidimicrobiales bacterium]
MTDHQGNERVRAVVGPPLTDKGFELVDVEREGPVLKVTVDLLVGPGDQVDRAGGIDMDAVTEATRLVNELLDRHDLVGDKTTLEVSSPGIERPLRTPEHFKRFVGTEVAVKAKPGTEGDRRLAGVLEAADEEGVVVAGRRLAYEDIEKARTVFVWPPPGRPAGEKTGSQQKAKKIGRAS